MKKYKPNHRYTYITFFILLCALEFLLWGICGSKPWIKNTSPWWVNLIYTGCNILLIGFATIFYVKKVYYLVDDKSIYRHGKDIKQYNFKEIVFIDEDYANTHIECKMYLSRGIWVLLTLDKNKEILKLIKERSPLLTYEELVFKYPKALEKNYEKK